MASASFGESAGDWAWICLGVLISVVLPLLAAYVKTVFGRPQAAAGIDFKRYLVLLLFCAVTSLVVLAIFRAAKPDEQIAWYAALLAGYGWEATLEKIIADPQL